MYKRFKLSNRSLASNILLNNNESVFVLLCRLGVYARFCLNNNNEKHGDNRHTHTRQQAVLYGRVVALLLNTNSDMDF